MEEIVCRLVILFSQKKSISFARQTPHIKLYILCGIPDMQRSNATNNVSIEYPVETVIYFNKHEFKDTFREFQAKPIQLYR